MGVGTPKHLAHFRAGNKGDKREAVVCAPISNPTAMTQGRDADAAARQAKLKEKKRKIEALRLARQSSSITTSCNEAHLPGLVFSAPEGTKPSLRAKWNMPVSDELPLSRGLASACLARGCVYQLHLQHVVTSCRHGVSLREHQSSHSFYGPRKKKALAP